MEMEREEVGMKIPHISIHEGRYYKKWFSWCFVLVPSVLMVHVGVQLRSHIFDLFVGLKPLRMNLHHKRIGEKWV